MLIEIPGAANGFPGSYNLDQLGEAFYLIECTGEVEIRMDDSPAITYRKSTGERLPKGERFKFLEFINHGSPLTVRVWVGFGEYVDRRFELLESTTRARGWDGAQEIPAGSFVDFAPQLGGGVLRRKAIIVTNLDANENLRLTDTDGNTFMTVFARSSVTLPISDVLRINNDTGDALSCNVGQIEYVESNLIQSAS